MKIFRILFAFFQALLTLLGFGFICTITYFELEFPYNIVISVLVLTAGFTVSRFVYNITRRRDILSVISGSSSTYDLDELDPIGDNNVLKLSPEELVNHFHKQTFIFNRNVTISIWGDWEGKMLNNKHCLVNIEFEKNMNTLTLSFLKNCSLKIKNPKLIFLSKDYFKIVRADEIEWEIPYETNFHRFKYINNSEEIITKSNTNWKPNKYDLGIGMNAIYLQG